MPGNKAEKLERNQAKIILKASNWAAATEISYVYEIMRNGGATGRNQTES